MTHHLPRADDMFYPSAKVRCHQPIDGPHEGKLSVDLARFRAAEMQTRRLSTIYRQPCDCLILTHRRQVQRGISKRVCTCSLAHPQIVPVQPTSAPMSIVNSSRLCQAIQESPQPTPRVPWPGLRPAPRLAAQYQGRLRTGPPTYLSCVLYNTSPHLHISIQGRFRCWPKARLFPVVCV